MPGCKNFPMRDQLHEKAHTKDGKADENKSYNCVPESIVSCVEFWTGKVVAADDIKDIAYGQGHIGGGAASVYDDDTAPYAGTNGQQLDESYGIEIEKVVGDRAALIAAIKKSLDAGIPVLITMPSDWNGHYAPKFNVDDPNFGTHVGVAYWHEGDNLTVMNPWGGFAHTQSFAWWQARLCYKSVYPVRKLAGGADMAVPANWKDDGKVITAPNNVQVIRGFAVYIRKHEWSATNVPLEAEHPVGDGTEQLFRESGLTYTTKTDVVPMNLGERFQAAQQQAAALLQQVADLQAQLASQPVPTPVEAPALTDEQKADLAAMAALREALKVTA